MDSIRFDGGTDVQGAIADLVGLNGDHNSHQHLSQSLDHKSFIPDLALTEEFLTLLASVPNYEIALPPSSMGMGSAGRPLNTNEGTLFPSLSPAPESAQQQLQQHQQQNNPITNWPTPPSSSASDSVTLDEIEALFADPQGRSTAGTRDAQVDMQALTIPMFDKDFVLADLMSNNNMMGTMGMEFGLGGQGDASGLLLGMGADVDGSISIPNSMTPLMMPILLKPPSDHGGVSPVSGTVTPTSMHSTSLPIPKLPVSRKTPALSLSPVSAASQDDHSGGEHDETTTPSQPLPSSKNKPTTRKRRKLTPEEKEQKAQERVLRNRQAAQESRDKKRKYVEDLESVNEHLEKQNETLIRRLESVEKRNESLSSKLEELVGLLGMFRKKVKLDLDDLSGRDISGGDGDGLVLGALSHPEVVMRGISLKRNAPAHSPSTSMKTANTISQPPRQNLQDSHPHSYPSSPKTNSSLSMYSHAPPHPPPTNRTNANSVIRKETKRTTLETVWSSIGYLLMTSMVFRPLVGLVSGWMGNSGGNGWDAGSESGCVSGVIRGDREKKVQKRANEGLKVPTTTTITALSSNVTVSVVIKGQMRHPISGKANSTGTALDKFPVLREVWNMRG
ncbi:hypothetical protein HDU85_004277 [Gaertneriomyces sp. JEL0708]|nr:hypothetical protein HDU85_004277 [Gaertneriomyces sp. JEL0708]